MNLNKIYIDNVKSFAGIAYNLQCMAKDPECPHPEQYKVAAEDSLNTLIEYIKDPESFD